MAASGPWDVEVVTVCIVSSKELGAAVQGLSTNILATATGKAIEKAEIDPAAHAAVGTAASRTGQR